MDFKKSFFQNVLKAEMEKIIYKTNKEVDDAVQVNLLYPCFAALTMINHKTNWQ